MSTLLINALRVASDEIDRIRNDILAIDPSKAISSPVLRDNNARIIASSYVWISAILERFFKSTLEALFYEMNAVGIQHDQLKPSLFSATCSSELLSLKDLNDHKKIWPRRVQMFSRLWQSQTVTFKMTDIPYDGRTIRPDHLRIAWAVFGINGNPFPTPLHELSLTEIADGRNNVAHGETDPITFGRGKNPTDFLKTISRIEDIIIHMGTETESYLKNSGYIR